MYNELIFVMQSSFIGFAALGALYLGQSALVAFVCIQSILANFFVLKQTVLFGLEVTCSDAFAIGAVLGLNFLQEYYGKAEARKTIWINFAMLIFYAIVSQIHLWYLPSLHDTTQHLFYPLLYVMPRIVFASVTVCLVVDQFDAWLYGYLKARWPDQLLMRGYTSLALSQLIDTVLFTLIGLYGITHNLFHVIVVSYCIKLVTVFLVGPFVQLSKGFSTN